MSVTLYLLDTNVFAAEAQRAVQRAFAKHAGELVTASVVAWRSSLTRPLSLRDALNPRTPSRPSPLGTPPATPRSRSSS